MNCSKFDLANEIDMGRSSFVPEEPCIPPFNLNKLVFSIRRVSKKVTFNSVGLLLFTPILYCCYAAKCLMLLICSLFVFNNEHRNAVVY